MNTMNKYYTPEQYILKSLGMYPTLYIDYSYDGVRLRVLDHVFNTIGNGLDKESFEYQDYDFESAKKYITDESLWYGYHEEDITRKIMSNGETYCFPTGKSILTCLESEKSQYSNMVYWVESNRYPHEFYPNFDKKYSLVWKPLFKKLPLEWTEDAIWFYTQARDYFNNDPHNFHYAFPNGECSVEKQIKEFEHFIKDYKSYEEISKAYELEYTGDTYDFLSRRWQVELTRIKEFIDETLNMLYIEHK